MKYKLGSNKNEIDIEVTDTEGKQSELLQAFQECQEGNCTCPTQEYSKLESIEIKQSGDSLKLKLRSKPDTEFDNGEIEKCLEYTKRKLRDNH